jgi:hypothetical protein
VTIDGVFSPPDAAIDQLVADRQSHVALRLAEDARRATNAAYLHSIFSAYASICSSSVISPSGSFSVTHASNAAIAAQYWQFG